MNLALIMEVSFLRSYRAFLSFRVQLLYICLMGTKFKSFSSSRLKYNSIAASFSGGLNLNLGLKGLGSNILLSLRQRHLSKLESTLSKFVTPTYAHIVKVDLSLIFPGAFLEFLRISCLPACLRDLYDQSSVV